MSITNYPQGVSSFGVPLLGSGGADIIAGDVFFVSSTHANASDTARAGAKTEPFATLDFAFAQTTANVGDVIYILPNHSETITGAAGIAHDVAGVSVIGLGHGGQRPTFLMDGGTAVTYSITANDALVRNLVFNSGHADIVTCFDVQVATDAWIDGCEFGDNVATENWITCVKSGTATDNQCDGLRVTNCKWFSVDAASLEFIEITGNTNRPWIDGNVVRTAGTGLAALVVGTAGDSLFEAWIGNNYIINADAADAVTVYSNNQTDNTGIITGNRIGTLDIAGEVTHTASNTGLWAFENYSTSVPTVSGYLLPVMDS